MGPSLVSMGPMVNTLADIDGEMRCLFKANLDTGLHRTSIGARIFGALKGASDGGTGARSGAFC